MFLFLISFDIAMFSCLWFVLLCLFVCVLVLRVVCCYVFGVVLLLGICPMLLCVVVVYVDVCVVVSLVICLF